ncbi:MAG: DUF374 domain-containing protein [Candidatus Omnitrophota bacterium]|nr:MAG: DUF374 domain-containing protein [Candidatus Omnitrophota bacterium]
MVNAPHQSTEKSRMINLPYWVSFPASFYIRLVGLTSGFEWIGVDFRPLLRIEHSPHIFACWHSRLMLPIYYYRKCKVTGLASQSKDGEFITQVMNRFQIPTVRGSSSRQGMEGLLRLTRCLRRGSSVVITPDGPRGPREEVQPGIIQLAKLTGFPIIPITFSCSRRKHFNSWDRFLVPLPFGKARMITGEKIIVTRDAPQTVLEEKRLQLQEELTRITRLADHF